MHADHLTVALADDAATLDLGARLAAVAEPGLVIWLEGDLGAGKTTLVRGLLRAAGETGPVKSPTYTLVEVHVVSGLNFYHFDFYRFNVPEEYLDAGLDEYFAGQGVCLVEWPDKASPYLPSADLRIELQLAGEGRVARLVAGGARGQSCLSALSTRWPGAAASSSSPPPA